ncbi:MAG: hypothetical protein IPJ00_22610 [Saprospirales bacterium]|nr:hypothetical protein [Saprospirales bacterium]
MKDRITILMDGNFVIIHRAVADAMGLKNGQRVSVGMAMSAIAENARYMIDLIQLIKPQPERSN